MRTSNTKKHYVYRHVRTDKGIPFYVGKGSRERAYRMTRRNKIWTDITKKTPFKVEVIKYFNTNQEALDFESKLIKLYKNLGYCIANVLTRGYSKSDLKFTEEHKRKISEASKGRVPWNKGKKLSRKHVENLSKAKKGKVYSKEYKNHMAETKGSKQFYVYKFESLEYVGSFISKKGCQKALKVDRSNIAKCLKGIYKQCNGYIFTYSKLTRSK